MDYREFEEKLGHRFHNKKYLITALTHSSYANEAKGKEESNERWSFWAIRCSGLWLRIICLKITRNFPRGISPKTALPGVRKGMLRLCEADRPGELSAVEPRRAEFRRAHPLVHFGGCV